MKHIHWTYIGFLILFYSCNQDKRLSKEARYHKDREKLARYFTADTSGFISSMDPLTYILNLPLADLPQDKDLNKLIRIPPEVKGTVRITGHTVIKFTPEGSWENGNKF